MSEHGDAAGRGRGETTLPYHPKSSDVHIYLPASGPMPVPDAKVKSLEDATALQIKKISPTSMGPEMPLRPAFGTQGKPVVLWTNHFQLTVGEDVPLFRYEVKITSDEKGPLPTGKKAKRIIQLLLEENFESYKFQIASDFKANLVSRCKLDLPNQSFSVTYRTEGETSPILKAKKYRILLTPAGSVSVADLVEYLSSPKADAVILTKAEIIQVLNIIVGYIPKTNEAITNVGANKHYDRDPKPQERASLGGGLEVIRGIFISVRPATARLLLNVQVQNTAFYNQGSLEALMFAFHQKDSSMFKLERFLKKLSIDRVHLNKKNASGTRIPSIKTIQSLANMKDAGNDPPGRTVSAFGAGPLDVYFFMDEKKTPTSRDRRISVFQFFKDTYGITITNPKLPVVNVGSRERPIYLPPQVCQVMAGQTAKTVLRPDQTKAMIEFAVRKPAMNAQTIVELGARLPDLNASNPNLKAFGIRLPPKLLAVAGRVLANPKVNYAAKKTISPQYASWNLRDVKLVTPAELPKWAWLRISVQGSHPQDDIEFNKKIQDFRAGLQKLGMKVAESMGGLRITVNYASKGKIDKDDLNNKIDGAFRKFISVPAKQPILVLAIIPEEENKPIYNRVKLISDTKAGLLSICVLEKNFIKAADQYIANVGLKFNLKLGGRNHTLEPSKLGILKEAKTMVVGIDVTHPSPGSLSTAPSVAGIVASVDEWLNQWPSELKIQPARQEMVDDLDLLIVSRLKLWGNRNQSLPENILIFRDGVSEGQYNDVLTKELPAIRRGCARLYKQQPRITIVICGKRHHTRFYPTKPADADKNSHNIVNGTVVDRGVTEARNWDFYLAAHSALKGTTKPCHYYIIYDQIFREAKFQAPFKSAADALEDLIHNMCYFFGRATKAVSLCPPAYYADLLCTRARCYLASLYEPEAGSSDGGSDAGGGVSDALVKIHARVADSMFYI